MCITLIKSGAFCSSKFFDIFSKQRRNLNVKFQNLSTWFHARDPIQDKFSWLGSTRWNLQRSRVCWCWKVSFLFKQFSKSNKNLLHSRAFVDPLKLFLSRKKPSVKVLDLGAIEALTYHGTDFLKLLNRPQDLEEITLASIKFDPSHYPILAVEHVFFEKCTSLQVLSLDYDTLNEDILKTIQILPLKTFMICVHGLDLSHSGISETAWTEFSNKFKTIKLVLTLIYAYEAVEILQMNLLRRNMPITHLRVLFCKYVSIFSTDFVYFFFSYFCFLVF